MDLSTAINVFLKQAIRENRIPFTVHQDVPNAETIAAMRECEEMMKHPEQCESYASFAELLADLHREDEEDA